MSIKTAESVDLILRDKLAIDRTRLANQRTLLSYIRTGMYFVATALAIFHLEDKLQFTSFEWGLLSVGIISMIFGIVNYLIMRKKILKAYH